VAFSTEFCDFIVEQLEPIGPVQVRRMFGGAGLYLDDTIFAILANDVLYFKVNEANEADFIAEGMAVFDPFGDPKRQIRSYRECPPRLLEDPDELGQWARVAWAAGRHAEAQKSQKKRPLAKPE
jgi:DNA transformation protein